MLAQSLAFPDSLPHGYQCFEDEFQYDPDKHLAPSLPDRVWSLAEFGYTPGEIESCASPVAVTSPFRLLSDEGVKVLHQIATRLKSQQTNIAGSRVPAHLAGGVYRSKFLRDFCACPEVLRHMSAIAGTTLASHSMPSQQLYINYAPRDLSKAVDSWHYDGIGFDYVLMLSDPAKLQGGNFEYFKGTKFEIAKMFDRAVHQVRYGIKQDLPQDRVIKVAFPAAGYAVFQQGNMVVHRAAKLDAPGDRITIVPGMVSLDVSVPDPTAKHDIPHYQEPGIVNELGRHSVWLAQAKLANLIESIGLNEDPDALCQELQRAISDVTEAVKYIGATDQPLKESQE